MKELSPIDWAMRPLKRYAQFAGRAPRAEYWWFWLGYMLVYVVIQILVRASAIFGLLDLLFLGLVVPMIAVAVRRMHDTDRSGWWVVAPIVPYLVGFALILPRLFQSDGNPPDFGSLGPGIVFFFIGFVLALTVFIFSVLPGTQGPNRYGPDPYDEDNLEEVFA